jgi:HSP20 family protein
MEMKSFLPSIFSGKTEHDPFRALQKQIDQVFTDFSRDLPGVPWARNGAFSLAVDVAETERAIEIIADLPGVDEKDINVSLSGDVFTIKAEKKSQKEEKGKDFHLSERSYGVFERSMVLPFRPESSKVDAKFEKGVLRVSINKPADVKALTQKIPIKAAA